MSHDTRRLTLLVSRASQHLQSRYSRMATALIDISDRPRMLFSNSALSRVGGEKLFELARQHSQKEEQKTPYLAMTLLPEDNSAVFFVVLDERHVLVIIGSEADQETVQVFYEKLQALLMTRV
jgi:hypothetical protein